MTADTIPFRIVLVLALVLSIISLNMKLEENNDHTVNALESVDPIRIESNTEMANHPDLDSGSGTHNDPYIFANMDIDCTSSGTSGLYISETTRYAVFRNITIQASSSSPAIYLKTLTSGGYRALQITLDNITVIGGGTQLYMDRPYYINVRNCNFSNPSGSGKLIHANSYGYYIYLKNNTFNAPSMDIDLDVTSYSYVRENRGNFRFFYMDRFRYSDIANNTFDMITMRLYSGYHSTVQGNEFTGKSDSYDTMWIIDCSRLWIHNNSFYDGRDSIHVQHPNGYSPVHNAYYSTTPLIFAHNLFNGSFNRGIYFYYANGHAYIRYVQVRHNIFRGCGGFAIEVFSGGSATSKVFRNVFEYNHGSGTTYRGNQVQARDAWSQFRWSDNGVGNYWLDWDNTDDNSDGFADNIDYPLSSSNGQKDPYPVSNPFFDFTQPVIELITPSERFLDNRYVNFTWDAHDNQTGIRTVQIKRGVSGWQNITGRDHHGLYLPKGQSLIDVRAVDNAGLKKEINLNIQIQQGEEPVDLISPINGRYYGTSEIEASWTVIEGMVPGSLTMSTDGSEWSSIDPYDPIDLLLPDGDHTLHLNFTDHYQNEMLYSIPFHVDTEDPELEILFPKAGSVISNNLVNFRWSVVDSSPLSSTMISVDGEEPGSVQGDTYSKFLDKGSHSFEVEVEDMAGNTRTKSIFFTISKNTSLHIKSPRLTLPTKWTEHTLEWEYLTDIDIASLQLMIDERQPIDIPLGSLSTEITLEEEGVHEIHLKAMDPAGNVFSDEITIQVDRTAPDVGFTYPENGQIMNRSEFVARWSALEEGGMSGYELVVDNETVMKEVLDRQSGLSLSPGEHTLRIIATDLAGNSADSFITILIDTKKPTVEITSPADDVVTDPYITISWTGSDDHGIVNYNYSIDGKKPQDAGTTTSREIQLAEGFHTLIVRAIDVAGNAGQAEIEFVSDLHPPTVSLMGPESQFISEWSNLISWNITEGVGVKEIVITIDGTPLSLATDSDYHIVDLEEGEHTISLEVTDTGGWKSNDTIRFTLDSTEPRVGSDKETRVDGREATIFWNFSENPDGMDMVVILDGKRINTPARPGDGKIVFRELESGNHEVEVIFADRAGNEKTLAFEFEVTDEDKGAGVQEEGSKVWLIILLMIAIITGLIIGAVVLRKKKLEEQRGGKEEKENGGPARKPDRISIGPLPARRDHTAARSRKSPAPAPPAEEKSHQGNGEGYIRPEKKERKRKEKRVIRDAPRTSPEDNVKASMDESDDIEEWGEVEDWSDMEEMEEFEEMEEI